MGHQNGIITTTGINTADVSAVLGAASNDVGTLCRHPNVNMWAKYKPVSYPHPQYNGSANNVGNESWKGDDNSNPYGIVKPKTSVGAGFSTSLVTTALSYKKPDTPSSYRLGDFRGYDHNCKIPYSITLPDGEFPQNQNRIMVLFDKWAKNAYQLSDGNLTFDEIFEGLYPCVVVKSSSATNYFTMSGDAPTVSIKDSPIWNASAVGTTLNVYVCACNRALSGWVTSIPSNATLYGVYVPGLVVSSTVKIGAALTDTYSGTVKITNVSSVISAVPKLSSGKIIVDCTVKSLSGRYAEYLLTSVTITTTNNATGAAIGSPVTRTSGGDIGNYTITSSTRTFQFSFDDFSPSKGGVASANYDIVCTFTPQGNPIGSGGGGGAIL